MDAKPGNHKKRHYGGGAVERIVQQGTSYPEKWISLRPGENGVRKMTQEYPKREDETYA
jgi:hypothetical protein